MRFREEVLAKVLTYITVLVLLGIIVFEGYTLQSERSQKRQLKEQLVVSQESISNISDMNVKLQEQIRELSGFKEEWQDYAAFADGVIVLELKEDLFSRPELIPQEAVEALYLAKEEDSIKEDEIEEEEEETILFTFDQPAGNETFMPLNTGLGKNENCIIYTAAYDEEQKYAIELLYEISLTGLQGTPQKNKKGEIDWNCIAYNIGEGWVPLADMNRGDNAS